ncbi:MAG: COG1361 S-layer family protein [Candidatus Nanohaloarchaea archaeon]
MKRTTHFGIKFALAITTLLSVTGTVSAVPQLDAVSYDPAFITAGDRVNISANLHETQTTESSWNPDRQLKVVLVPDNRLAEEYVTIEDARDESIGFLYPDGVWNQRFQVRVHSDAPTGKYDFELHIQYLENGEPVKIQTRDGGTTLTYVEDFTIPVDNEGVDLTTNVLETEPSVPRPGDDHVEMQLEFTNTGNKPVEDIELLPRTPEHVTPSFSGDEKFYVDRLDPGKTSRKTLSLDLNEELEPGLHRVNISATYEDEDGNPYSEQLDAPLRVEGRPDLELVGSGTEMKAGETSQLRLKIRNRGAQDAESVTARVIAERTQPFSLADRSSYIGEIEAGETAAAILDVKADRSATLRTHQLKIQLRANGDSEEGDHSVYTFTEKEDVKLTGRTRSLLVYAGIAATLLVLAAAAYRYGIKPARTGGGEN